MDSFVLARPCKQLSPGFPGLGLPVERPYLLLLTRYFEEDILRMLHVTAKVCARKIKTCLSELQ